MFNTNIVTLLDKATATDFAQIEDVDLSSDSHLGIDQCKYCSKYGSYYREIYKAGMKWLTISPPYSNWDVNDLILKWRSVMNSMENVAKKYLYIFELSDQQRLHIHCVYVLKNPRAEYCFLNKLRCGSFTGIEKVTYGLEFCKPAMVRTYKGQPRKGCHYLFKDIDDVLDFDLKEEDVIITKASLDLTQIF